MGATETRTARRKGRGRVRRLNHLSNATYPKLCSLDTSFCVLTFFSPFRIHYTIKWEKQPQQLLDRFHEYFQLVFPDCIVMRAWRFAQVDSGFVRLLTAVIYAGQHLETPQKLEVRSQRATCC